MSDIPLGLEALQRFPDIILPEACARRLEQTEHKERERQHYLAARAPF